MVSSTSKTEMGELGDVISRFTSKKSRRLEMSCISQCTVSSFKLQAEGKTTDMLAVAQGPSQSVAECKQIQSPPLILMLSDATDVDSTHRRRLALKLHMHRPD